MARNLQEARYNIIAVQLQIYNTNIEKDTKESNLLMHLSTDLSKEQGFELAQNVSCIRGQVPYMWELILNPACLQVYKSTYTVMVLINLTKGGVALRGVSWDRQNPFKFCVCLALGIVRLTSKYQL